MGGKGRGEPAPTKSGVQGPVGCITWGRVRDAGCQAHLHVDKSPGDSLAPDSLQSQLQRLAGPGPNLSLCTIYQGCDLARDFPEPVLLSVRGVRTPTPRTKVRSKDHKE